VEAQFECEICVLLPGKVHFSRLPNLDVSREESHQWKTMNLVNKRMAMALVVFFLATALARPYLSEARQPDPLDGGDATIAGAAIQPPASPPQPRKGADLTLVLGLTILGTFILFLVLQCSICWRRRDACPAPEQTPEA
jgi:hypothetical protein